MGLNHDRLQQNRTRTGGGPGWKPKEGDNKVRFLHPTSRGLTEDLDFIAIKYVEHWFNEDGAKATVTRCPGDLKQKCPACTAYWKYRKVEGDPALKALIDRIKPGERYIFNLIDLNNIAGGLQRWNAPWSVWDKVMEICGNPAWGDPLAPAAGNNFNIVLTPANKSRNGIASYSATPDPQKTNIMGILDQIPNWQQFLDGQAENFPEAKTIQEINNYLAEMGIPGHTGIVTPHAPGAVPVEAPQVSVPVAQPQPVPVAQPVPVVAPQPVPIAQPVASYVPAPGTPPPAAVAAPNLDPSGKAIPAGAPVCFSQYNPQVHPCGTCPFMGPCQMRYLGVG